MSRLTKTSLLLAFFFALDKIAAIFRQIIIARQFGLSAELDAFNVANNLPDMLFALISGGALAIAFIPVLSEVITRQGRDDAWELFSRIANLAFLVTGILAIIIAVSANGLVRWEIGVAPGFGEEQQKLVAMLMRLNLAATLIFSISGLVMAGLQANPAFPITSHGSSFLQYWADNRCTHPITRKRICYWGNYPSGFWFGGSWPGLWRDPGRLSSSGDSNPGTYKIQIQMDSAIGTPTARCSKGNQPARAAIGFHAFCPTYLHHSR